MDKIDQALAAALELPLQQRIQLLKRIASSIEQDIDPGKSDARVTDAPWGQTLVRLMDEAGTIDMVHPQIEDATAWVKQIRRDQEIKRGLDWDSAE